jgi:hypothetical protein
MRSYRQKQVCLETNPKLVFEILHCEKPISLTVESSELPSVICTLYCSEFEDMEY